MWGQKGQELVFPQVMKLTAEPTTVHAESNAISVTAVSEVMSERANSCKALKQNRVHSAKIRLVRGSKETPVAVNDT